MEDILDTTDITDTMDIADIMVTIKVIILITDLIFTMETPDILEMAAVDFTTGRNKILESSHKILLTFKFERLIRRRSNL